MYGVIIRTFILYLYCQIDVTNRVLFSDTVMEHIKNYKQCMIRKMKCTMLKIRGILGCLNCFQILVILTNTKHFF